MQNEVVVAGLCYRCSSSIQLIGYISTNINGSRLVSCI